MSRSANFLKALFKPKLKTDIPVKIILTSGHTGNAIEVFASDGTTSLFSVGPDGSLTPAAGSDLADDVFKVHDPADATKKARLDAGGVTAGQTRVLTVPDYNGTIATVGGTETLTGKTLTSPKIGTSILDTNGAELFKLTATGTAVNELTYANAATGGAPAFTATGDDTHISVKVAGKGNGKLLASTGLLQYRVASSNNTASNLQYTAAQLLGGLYLRDCNGGSRADKVPSAADLVAAVPGVTAGSSFMFALRNTSDAAETITLTANGADTTMSGTMTVAQSNTKLFTIVIDNVGSGTEAYTVYSVGTLVH